jgi:GNAT superfamily N-acetyltransferase
MTIQPLEEIHHDAVVDIMGSLPEWFTLDAVEHFRIDLRYHRGFIAIDEDTHAVSGFITYFAYDGVGIISWIGIDRKHHHQGIGSQLVQVVEQALRADEISIMQVYTLGDSVDYKPYEATRAFYYGNGFKEYRRIKTDNPGCPEELYLRKSL